MRRAGLFFALGLLATGIGCESLAAQLRVQSLAVRCGAAFERYTGTFSVVTVPIVDSTDQAIAGASECGFTGRMNVLRRADRTLEFTGGAAVRQLATAGFQQRNYAPREHSFEVQGNYAELLAGGQLDLVAIVDGRSVTDLPAMPLYLPPGYVSYSGEALFSKSLGGSHTVDAGIAVGEKDYAGPSVLPNLDLLDYRSAEARASASRLFRSSSDTQEASRLRFFAAYHHRRYHRQGNRSDHAALLGGAWWLDFSESRGLEVDLNATATLNRSNSSRVEYNSLKVEAVAHKTFGDNIVSVSGTWADKSYVNPQDFLVPGEEADNAVILYGELTRFLSSGVRATFGGGWQRAETNISGDYYDQFRISFSLRANLLGS